MLRHQCIHTYYVTRYSNFDCFQCFQIKNWNGPNKTISFCTTIMLVLGPLSSHKYLRSVDDVARVAPIVSTIFFFHLPCRPYYTCSALFFSIGDPQRSLLYILQEQKKGEEDVSKEI